jgi:uncharacterized protein YndB with AHSA1/START domain
MASVRKETLIEAPVERVWDALRDWGAVHERLVPGFVVDARLDGSDRLVTFFNGTTVREVMIDLDDADRRLVWSVVDGPYSHHNSCAQVFGEDGRTRFVWITDFLPHEEAERMEAMMERGATVLRDMAEKSSGATGARPARR